VTHSTERANGPPRTVCGRQSAAHSQRAVFCARSMQFAANLQTAVRLRCGTALLLPSTGRRSQSPGRRQQLTADPGGRVFAFATSTCCEHSVHSATEWPSWRTGRLHWPLEFIGEPLNRCARRHARPPQSSRRAKRLGQLSGPIAWAKWPKWPPARLAGRAASARPARPLLSLYRGLSRPLLALYRGLSRPARSQTRPS